MKRLFFISNNLARIEVFEKVAAGHNLPFMSLPKIDGNEFIIDDWKPTSLIIDSPREEDMAWKTYKNKGLDVCFLVENEREYLKGDGQQWVFPVDPFACIKCYLE